MKIVAIIQARMGSTRLPGKVLKDICGQTMLAHVVRRSLRAKHIHKIVVATTKNAEDYVICDECERLGVAFFRGSQNDVLDRYYRAALHHRADVAVRITSDCPLIDPGVIDDVILAFLNKRPDYASNTLVRTFPRGLDTEVVSVDALARAWREATENHQREHVTPYIYENPGKFNTLAVTGERDYSTHRWTVDTSDDLIFVRSIYEGMTNVTDNTWHQVLDLLEEQPQLTVINHHIRQKAIQEA